MNSNTSVPLSSTFAPHTLPGYEQCSNITSPLTQYIEEEADVSDTSTDIWLDTVLERVLQSQDFLLKQHYSPKPCTPNSANQIPSQTADQNFTNQITDYNLTTQHGVNAGTSTKKEHTTSTNQPITEQYFMMDQSESNVVSSSSHQDTDVSSTIKEEPTVRKRKILPPCKVCGEKASGLHYGVNTCEACKGFYRRSLVRGENFHCGDNWTCEIAPDTRNNCAACRYKKCIALGMSKDAIKIGRYTHEKKTQDILEVNNNHSNIPLQSGADSTGKTNTDRKQKKYEALTPPDSDACDDVQQLLVDNEKTTCLSGAAGHDNHDSSMNTSKYLSEVDRKRLVGLPSIYEQKISCTLSAVEEVMRYTKSLSQSMMYMKYFFAAAPPSVLSHIVKTRLHTNPLEKQILEEPTVKSEIPEIVPDDERKELIQHWAESIEETFVVIAQFAKSVPGFKTLPLIDRINLIKGTRSRLLFIASHKRFDVQNRCFIGRFNRVDTFTDIVKIYNNSKFVDGMMNLAEEYLKIRLNDVEWLLVLSIFMCWPDEEVWSELSKQAKDRLAAMYSQQLRILDFYLRMNHPHEYRLKEVILTAFNATVERDREHSKLLGEVRAIWKDFYNFPPLFQEIIKRDFRAPLIPRRTPKSPPSPVNSTPPTPPINQSTSTHANRKPNSSTDCKRHWKKSKIASILETSDHIEQLMKLVVKRSKYDAAPHPKIKSIHPTTVPYNQQPDIQPLPQTALSSQQQTCLPMNLSAGQEIPSSRTHPLIDLSVPSRTFPDNLLTQPQLDVLTNQNAFIPSSADQTPAPYLGTIPNSLSNHMFSMRAANQSHYVPITANKVGSSSHLTNQNAAISTINSIPHLATNMLPMTHGDSPRSMDCDDILMTFPPDENLLPILSDCYGISSGEPFPEAMQSDLDMLIPSPIEHSLLNSLNQTHQPTNTMIYSQHTPHYNYTNNNIT